MPRKYQIYVLALFFLIGFVAYSNILNSYFLSDDFVLIGKVSHGNLPATWGQSHDGFFRPVLLLSCLMDFEIWGFNPFGFHLTNVSLHSLNAFLTFSLAMQLIQDVSQSDAANWTISLGAGFLFLLHPSHTEAVTWISGRADVIATLFCLSTLLALNRYSRRRNIACLATSLAFFILALLAKESSIGLPFIIFLMGLVSGDASITRSHIKQTGKIALMFLLVLCGFVLVRSVLLGAVVGGYGTEQHLNFSPSWLRDRFIQAVLRSVLPPFPAEWSTFLLKPLKSLPFLFFSIACLGIITIVLAWRHKTFDLAARKTQNRFLLLLLAMFVFSLLPVINLRLSLFQTQGERWLYWPTVFSCLTISYFLAILIRQTRMLLTGLLLTCAFFTVSLYHSNQTWREAAKLSKSIQEDLVSSAKQNSLVIINAPDNLRGVPVYRNGLAQAVKSFQQMKPIERVDIVALHDLRSSYDSIAAVRDASSLSLQLNEGSEFTTISRSVECVEVIKQSPRELQIQFGRCQQGSDIFLFNQGRMAKLQ